MGKMTLRDNFPLELRSQFMLRLHSPRTHKSGQRQKQRGRERGWLKVRKKEKEINVSKFPFYSKASNKDATPASASKTGHAPVRQMLRQSKHVVVVFVAAGSDAAAGAAAASTFAPLLLAAFAFAFDCAKSPRRYLSPTQIMINYKIACCDKRANAGGRTWAGHGGRRNRAMEIISGK